MSFRTNNVDDRLIIDQNGSVGVGTATPGSKLEVVGGTVTFKNTGSVGFNNENIYMDYNLLDSTPSFKLRVSYCDGQCDTLSGGAGDATNAGYYATYAP